MAQCVHSLFVLFLLFITSTATSRIPPTTTTTSLDVSASLLQTQSFISQNFQGNQITQTGTVEEKQEKQGNEESSFLTLQLHSRDSIKHTAATTEHKDYKSLTLSRLARDSSRVTSLNSRLSIALSGLDLNADFKPAETESSLGESKGIEGPIVSGASQGSGEYFSRVGVGRPPKEMYLVLDTGSDVTWVQCQPCTDCYQQADPVFQPSASSTYSALSCQSKSCTSLDVSACRNDTCVYQVSYGDGSYTVGDFVTETLTFGGSSSVNNIAIGCGHDNEGLFVGAAGLLSLGGGSLSFPSQISATSFSYCLVDRDSATTSMLEFSTSPTPSAPTVAAPLIRNRKLDTFYYVGLSGISVGGQMLSIPPSTFALDESGSGGVIIDSGTAITRLRSDAYDALRDEFVKGTRNLPPTQGVALFDTCYDLSSLSSVEVPTIAFHFSGGKTLPLPAKNFLIPVDSTGTFCLAFAPTSSSMSIIGNAQQQGTRVSFDLGKSVVGFEVNKC